MKTRYATAIMLLWATPTLALTPLKVMTYNILHGQPCSGGSLGRHVAPRAELAVRGFGGAMGLADLAPDILGMQEVSQVFVEQSLEENQTCAVFVTLPFLGLDEDIVAEGGPDLKVERFEHQGDYFVRRMNGVTAALAGNKNKRLLPENSPYKMRFVRDNPRLVPLIPNIELPPDNKALSDHSAAMGDVEIGLAVISKHRIQEVTGHNLTIGAVPGETRALLHATIRIDDGSGNETPVDFFDSHLTTTGGDSPQTVLMAAEIVRIITATRRYPDSPAFFTCDCNLEEGEPAYEVFTGAGFIDTFRSKNPTDPGWTSGRKEVANDCDDTVGSRIDYVWVIPDSEGRIPWILSSEVVMNFHQDAGAPTTTSCLWPSDHNGVITTVDLDSLVTP